MKEEERSFKGLLFRIGLGFLQAGLSVLGKSRKSLVLSELAEHLTPIITIPTSIGDIKFFCPGKISIWRAETLLSKEPETIEWINGFEPGSVFWDIGANVGVYTLYAAKRKIKVMAFEPSAVNYRILSKNIEINGMHNTISGYCAAFSDTSTIGYLNMASTISAGALSCFGQSKDAYDVCGTKYDVAFKQGMIGFSLDDFVEKYSPPFPNYLKIDVDGIEDKIIAGASKTLRSEKLKALLIELDTEDKEYCDRVTSIIENAGLRLVKDRHAHTYDHKEFSSVYNHIFVR